MAHSGAAAIFVTKLYYDDNLLWRWNSYIMLCCCFSSADKLNYFSLHKCVLITCNWWQRTVTHPYCRSCGDLSWNALGSVFCISWCTLRVLGTFGLLFKSALPRHGGLCLKNMLVPCVISCAYDTNKYCGCHVLIPEIYIPFCD